MDVLVTVDEGVDHDGASLGERAEVLLSHLGLDEPELSIRVVDDVTMQALNAQWRGKDQPTDVLSFPMQAGRPTGGLLGDLVISVDTAARQARELGHPVAHEHLVLLVHGLCHLLGHDHHTPAEARAMAAEEARLLQVLGLDAAGLGLVERAGAAG